jgi:hypothetical protein
LRHGSISSRTGPHLSKRNVVEEMIHAYRDQWAFLLGAGLLVFVPVGLIEALDPISDVDTDEVDAVTAVEASALVAAQAVTTLIATVLYAGIVAAAVRARREGTTPHLPTLARRLPYARLIAADLLLSGVVVVGLVLLILPGLVLLTWFALVGPVIEIEHRRVTEAFRRSRALVRRHFWLAAVLVVPAFVAEELIADAVESGAASVVGDTFVSEWVGGLLGNLLTAPIFALAVVVLFYELRERSPAPSRG